MAEDRPQMPDKFLVTVTCPTCDWEGRYEVTKEQWLENQGLYVWLDKAARAHAIFGRQGCTQDPDLLKVKAYKDGIPDTRPRN